MWDNWEVAALTRLGIGVGCRTILNRLRNQTKIEETE